MDVHALFAKLIWLDWVVLLVVLGSVVQGLRRGFVRALLDLLGSLLAVVLALAVMPQATAYMATPAASILSRERKMRRPSICPISRFITAKPIKVKTVLIPE